MQWAADASQKSTCPFFTTVLPAFTVAVNATTVPDATLATGVPADETVSVVVVAAAARANCGLTEKTMNSMPRRDADHLR